MDPLAREIDTLGVMRLVKGNSFAFIFRSGRAKKGGGIKRFVWGCTKQPRTIDLYSTSATKMDFRGEGPKLFLC